MNHKRLMMLIVVGLLLTLVFTGGAEAAKPVKPPKPTATPMTPVDPEIAFAWKPKPKKMPNGVWIANADGSNETFVWDGHWPSWSPDATQLAINLWGDFPCEIWRVDADGSNVTLLADDMWHRPRWSPVVDPQAQTYNLIAYGNYSRGDLMVVDASGDTSPQVVLEATYPSDPVHGDWYESPSWSPDGQTLAATRVFADNSVWQIVIVPFGAPDDNYVVFESPNHMDTVDWARQHNWLAFTATVDDVRGTYVLDLDDLAAGPQLVVEGMRWASWSQDDSRLVGQFSGDVLYVYDFAADSLTYIHDGAFPDWKRCVTDPDTGVCSIP